MREDPAVLLDATSVPRARGGVGRYVDHLAAALSADGAKLTVVCQQRDAEIFSALAPGSRVVTVHARWRSRAARLTWEQTAFPRLISRLAVDVVHSPHYTMPVASPVPVVVTVHDATFFSHPELHTGVKGRFFRSWSRIAVRRAARCVVPSRATADQLRRHIRVGSDSIQVAYHGVDAGVFHPPTEAEIAAFSDTLSLNGRSWIAFLGTLEPRKNVPALIRGFVAAFGGRADAPGLVLAGASGWDKDIEPALSEVPADLSVIRTGHLPIDALPALLGGSLLVCYPSLGEGFGLPVLEAMACGSAVLTTRRLALPEVGGEAVAYCGVQEEQIAVAIGELAADADRRRHLADAAVRRAAGFTWQASARAHMSAYRGAVGCR